MWLAVYSLTLCGCLKVSHYVAVCLQSDIMFAGCLKVQHYVAVLFTVWYHVCWLFKSPTLCCCLFTVWRHVCWLFKSPTLYCCQFTVWHHVCWLFKSQTLCGCLFKAWLCCVCLRAVWYSLTVYLSVCSLTLWPACLSWVQASPCWVWMTQKWVSSQGSFWLQMVSSSSFFVVE